MDRMLLSERVMGEDVDEYNAATVPFTVELRGTKEVPTISRVEEPVIVRAAVAPKK